MKIKTQAIDHIWLWVHSLERSKAYYEALFGFRCTPRDGDAQTMLVEGESVHLFLRQIEGNGDFIGQQHLALVVSDLESVIASLQQHGIHDYTTGQVDCFTRRNYDWCEWRDPDGIRLECVAYID